MEEYLIMTKPDPGNEPPNRRSKRFLTPLQKYEVVGPPSSDLPADRLRFEDGCNSTSGRGLTLGPVVGGGGAR